MEPQEARKLVVNDIREVYAHAWTQFAFIKEDQARVRAINGVMITIDKVWPFLPPKDPPVPAQAPAAPTKAPTAALAAQPARFRLRDNSNYPRRPRPPMIASNCIGTTAARSSNAMARRCPAATRTSMRKQRR
jgi:hypothetical protein